MRFAVLLALSLAPTYANAGASDDIVPVCVAEAEKAIVKTVALAPGEELDPADRPIMVATQCLALMLEVCAVQPQAETCLKDFAEAFMADALSTRIELQELRLQNRFARPRFARWKDQGAEEIWTEAESSCEDEFSRANFTRVAERYPTLSEAEICKLFNVASEFSHALDYRVDAYRQGLLPKPD